MMKRHIFTPGIKNTYKMSGIIKKIMKFNNFWTFHGGPINQPLSIRSFVRPSSSWRFSKTLQDWLIMNDIILPFFRKLTSLYCFIQIANPMNKDLWKAPRMTLFLKWLAVIFKNLTVHPNMRAGDAKLICKFHRP